MTVNIYYRFIFVYIFVYIFDIYSRTSKIRTPDNRTDRSTEQHALARARALAKI